MRRLLAGVALAVASVSSVSAQPSPTAITDRLRTRYIRPIDFHAAIFPDTVWVGQQATYQVAVLLNADARSRLRRNPEFVPPELRGLLAYELGSPRRVPPRSYGTDVYEAHVFQRALFPVAPGTVVVPSPQLTYALPQSASYFSREERYSVAAESAQLVVRPLPEVGRPADFSGAIGTFRGSARLDAPRARVGDPLILTVRIEGIGNVKLLPRPQVEVSWASTVPGTERVQVDSAGPYVRGAKEFEYILTPTQEGPAVLPVVRYSYFDPFKGAYDVATTAPADLTIAAGVVAASAEEADETDLMPLRPWRETTALRLADVTPAARLVAAVLALLLPLLVVGQRMLARRPVRAASTRGDDRSAAAPPPADEDSAGGRARRVRRVLLDELASRLRVTATELVTRADVQRVLRRRGVTRTTTRDLLALLDDLAVAGFGSDTDRLQQAEGRDARTLQSRAERLLQQVAAEAVPHGNTRLWSRRLRRAGTLLVLLAASSAIVTTTPTRLGAQPTTTPESAAARLDSNSADARVLNGEAQAAYTARRFPRAATRYAELVARRPHDVDLLVNWGTAAWAANDTVTAVVAWQRASRLDPLAEDIQQRVALLPAGARAGIADVPMVPVVPLAAVALISWCIGWALWWWRRRWARSLATVLLVVGVLAGAAAWWGHRALDPAALAVVSRPETIRVAPASDANPMGGASTGDVVRVIAARPGWDEVEHADGRRGWMPAARLVSLSAPLLDTDRTR